MCVGPCVCAACVVNALPLANGTQGLSNHRVLGWPLQDFAPSVEVPTLTCQRAGCNACARHASVDDALCKPYEHHQSPSRRDLDAAVKQAARVRWRDEYAAQVDAQVTSRMNDSQELDEQDVRAAITRQVEEEMESALRNELTAARLLPKLRTCTRCWTGKTAISSRSQVPACPAIVARLAPKLAQRCWTCPTWCAQWLTSSCHLQWRTAAKNAKPLTGRCTRMHV